MTRDAVHDDAVPDATTADDGAVPERADAHPDPHRVAAWIFALTLAGVGLYAFAVFAFIL